MKPHAILAVGLAIALIAGSSVGAQLYRWVDEKGNVEWRDTPPPPNAKNVEQRNVGGNTIETSTLPYAVQQAVAKFPVTLWVFNCGEPCDRARAHLQKRGVPYTERDVQREPDTLKKLTGSLDVPVLLVGSKQLKGYLDTEWDAALDAAGYPRTPPPGMKAKVSGQTPAAKADNAPPASDLARKPQTP
jgi:glutaredoxin